MKARIGNVLQDYMEVAELRQEHPCRKLTTVCQEAEKELRELPPNFKLRQAAGQAVARLILEWYSKFVEGRCQVHLEAEAIGGWRKCRRLANVRIYTRARAAGRPSVGHSATHACKD